MVDITDKVQETAAMVDDGSYFCINRGRQYGKTTVLYALKHYLQSKYMVFSISFEGLSDEDFQNADAFKDAKFLENTGGKLFLLYLRPIINGVGHYYIEAQTRDETRTDIIVDYLGKRYIIELKIWHGKAYNEAGRQQLAEYLELMGEDEGYMLSFSFNKNKNIGLKEEICSGKKIVEVLV